MADNISYHNVSIDLGGAIVTESLSYTWILVAPEFINLTLLILAIYAMYQGIEICHPLYAILFLNVNIALAATGINILVFQFIPSELYVAVSNAINSIGLEFHCNCW